MRDLDVLNSGLDVFHASREEIAALQLKRLKWSLNHAFENSAMYQMRFKKAGVDPSNLETLADLAKFPFTFKNHLEESGPFGTMAVDRRDVVRMHASAGGHVKPVLVCYTEQDLENWAVIVQRALDMSGIKSGDTVLNLFEYGLVTHGLGAHAGLEKIGTTIIPMNANNPATCVHVMKDVKPDAVLVTPSNLLLILQQYKKLGLDPRQSSMRVAVLAGEPWSESFREDMEKNFDMKVVDVYGQTEIMGLGIASECLEEKSGLHFAEDHFYPEIIDPDTGQTVEDGQEGELVVTTLTKRGVPLIRFRTRDLTRILPASRFSVRRIEKPHGRSDDMIVVRGVSIYPAQIAEHVKAIKGISEHFQIALHKEGGMDVMLIHVEALQDAGDDATRRQVRQVLARGIKAALGVSVAVIVQNPGQINREESALRRVIDNRRKAG
jgi:phenylacetate-CoA ligase